MFSFSIYSYKKIQKQDNYTLIVSEDSYFTNLFSSRSFTGKSWIGGDIGTSIKLNKNLYLWLFGDTLIGNMVKDNQGNITRNITNFIHSSFSLLNLTHNLKPNFYLPEFENGTFKTSIFVSNKSLDPLLNIQNYYYWNLVGSMLSINGPLLILAADIVPDPISLFKQIGTDAILVANPFTPFNEWKYNTFTIPSSLNKNLSTTVVNEIFLSSNLTWNVAVLMKENDLYMYGSLKSGFLQYHIVLSKINYEDLIKGNWTAMQFWSHNNFVDGYWSSSFSNLKPLYDHPASESSIHWSSKLKMWYMPLCQAFWDNKITLITSPSLTGPWKKQLTYDIPHPYNNSTNFIAYGAKSHPEYSKTSDELIISYNTNTLNFQDLTKYPNSYIPRFIKINIVNKM
jgi:hypothetical protein